MTKTEIATLLCQILEEGTSRSDAIRRFQNEILHGDGPWNLDPDEWNVVCDLAWDLDFYVEDPYTRAQDASYYGAERLRAEIQGVWARLGLASLLGNP